MHVSRPASRQRPNLELLLSSRPEHTYRHSHRAVRHTVHSSRMDEVPDEYLADSMVIAKKIAAAQGFENYNILQVRCIPTYREVLPLTSLPE